MDGANYLVGTIAPLVLRGLFLTETAEVPRRSALKASENWQDEQASAL